MVLSNVGPNNYTFPPVLKSCGMVHGGYKVGKVIHGWVLKLGLGFDVYVNSSLVEFYVQSGAIGDARKVFDEMSVRNVVCFTVLVCGYLELGRLDEARGLFEEMGVRDVVAWNAVIAGCVKMGWFDEAIGFFEEMGREKVRVNESTLVTVLSACAQSGCITTGERISSYIMNHQLSSNVRVVNGLIDMYSKCGELDKARSLFDNVSNRNIVMWNVMISGYTHRHSYKESLDLFRTMLESDYKPNEVTLLSVIPACAHMGALDSGKWIHAYINKNFRDSSNTSLYTSLIDMYAKCGDIEAAKTVFKNVKTKNLASWNAMISGLAMHRRADEAIGLFKNMVNEGLTPDDITFVGVLSACSHGGLVNLGKKYFNLMIQEYKISPKLQHYGCVIDLLARADLFVEAMDIIKKMEVKPDSAIWGSLLGSCISYKNVQLGEYFAKKVLELDPESSGAHTLLSNLYAANGRWDDVARIRTKFRDEGSKKIPGCTSIEVNGIVHEFLASDKTHPMSDKIYAMLEETNRLLDNYGHVPDTSLVLYDMDDELKECVVSQHSERLAIAFGLISTKPGTPIRIMKNLRISMPKERNDRSVSTDKLRASPYQCSTGHLKRSLNKNPSESEETLQEWEDAQCPVCMEHPHNAILLLCSSHDKGCRPYMCDTSYRHSNCFDQFKKSLSDIQMSESLTSESRPSYSLTEESQPSATIPESLTPTVILEPSPTTENIVKAKSKLSCPLCRGEVNGTVVVDAARSFMNTKSRSCASETCDFSGTYADLRKHARNVHPFARPSEADPERQEDWRRMERQRDIGDLLSTLRSAFGEDRAEDITRVLSTEGGGVGLTLFFHVLVYPSGHSSRRSSLSGGSPARAEVTVRRRLRARLFGESYDDESSDDDNESSDGVESGESLSWPTFSLFNGDVEQFLEIDKKEENRLKECD
ncbi:pentatricopeptide repeat-containing protein [Tanacetum coccineum]